MELAVWTQPDRIEKRNGSTYRKLRGAVVVGITSQKIRAKWVELVADLIRPERRGGAYDFGPMTTSLQKAWSSDWYDAFRSMERGDITPDQAWAAMSGKLPELGKDPRGEVPITDTWLWGAGERKLFYLCKVDLEDEGVAQKIDYMRAGQPCNGYANTVDYANSLGMGAGDVLDIDNPNVVVQPKLNVTLAASKVVAVAAPGDVIGG